MANPEAAMALASPVGLREVLRLNSRFLSGDLEVVEMIEAVSSSPPFLGESSMDENVPLDWAEVDADAALFLELLTLLADPKFDVDGLTAPNSVLSASGLSTMGFIVTLPPSASLAGDVAALACCVLCLEDVESPVGSGT